MVSSDKCSTCLILAQSTRATTYSDILWHNFFLYLWYHSYRKKLEYTVQYRIIQNLIYHFNILFALEHFLLFPPQACDLTLAYYTRIFCMMQRSVSVYYYNICCTFWCVISEANYKIRFTETQQMIISTAPQERQNAKTYFQILNPALYQGLCSLYRCTVMSSC